MYQIIPALKAHQQALSAFEGYCIAYFRHEVLVGRWTDGRADFVHEPEWGKVLELHIFNALDEYRAVSAGDGSFRVRVCHDSQDEENVFDENILIIGNSAAQAADARFFTAAEKGRSVILPASLAQKSIIIRNYLRFEEADPQGMPGCEVMRITDWRFAGFADEMTCSDPDREVRIDA